MSCHMVSGPGRGSAELVTIPAVGRSTGNLKRMGPAHIYAICRSRLLEPAPSLTVRQSVVAVFAGAGVRSGEAIAMRVGSVEAAERSPRLRVLGKGNKPRVIPVGSCRPLHHPGVPEGRRAGPRGGSAVQPGAGTAATARQTVETVVGAPPG